MEALFAYSLSLFWLFYLLNYAEISARPAKWLKKVSGVKWGYPLSCAMCFGFWATVFTWIVDWAPWWYLITAPVVHLFIDLIYSKLSPPKIDEEWMKTWDIKP